MLIKISLLLLTTINFAYADFMEVSDKQKDKRVIDRKWSMNMGFDYRKVETGFKEFSGEHNDIKDNDSIEVWAIDLGLSRKLMNIGNFEIETKFSLSYGKTVNSTVGLASKEYDDIDFANERVDYQLLSGRANLVVGYTIETSLIKVRPFLEAGTGAGSSIIEREYTFEGIETDDSDYEHYDLKVNDEFLFTEVVLGVSFISKAGFISYLKAAQVASNITERSFKGDIQKGTAAAVDQKDTEKDISSSYTIFGLGLGYAF